MKAFPGNRCLKGIYDELLVGERTIYRLILHFSRPSAGRLVFSRYVRTGHDGANVV